MNVMFMILSAMMKTSKIFFIHHGDHQMKQLLIFQAYEDIEFTLVYEEETGWGGEVEIINGVVTLANQYNWRCSNCDFNTMDDIEYCEDCESCPCPNCGSTETDTTCYVHTKDSSEE